MPHATRRQLVLCPRAGNASTEPLLASSIASLRALGSRYFRFVYSKWVPLVSIEVVKDLFVRDFARPQT